MVYNYNKVYVYAYLFQMSKISLYSLLDAACYTFDVDRLRTDDRLTDRLFTLSVQVRTSSITLRQNILSSGSLLERDRTNT